MTLHHLSLQDRKRYQNLDLSKKIELSRTVIKKAFQRIPREQTALAWTGGKDSTLLLWLLRKVCQDGNLPLPKIMFVDEGDVFPEIRQFIKRLSIDWGFTYSVAHNSDVSSQAKKIGDMIPVSFLNKRNRQEINRLGFSEKAFPYEPESFVGNHLMKTVATNIWIEKNDIKALYVGVRWDEQPARAEDNYFRPIDQPDHTRVEPILHFKEKDVWEAIHQYHLPYVKLYEQGYRSLGARGTTQKTDNKPAWKQDLKSTKERSGRKQDKEKIMERLRALGYM